MSLRDSFTQLYYRAGAALVAEPSTPDETFTYTGYRWIITNTDSTNALQFRFRTSQEQVTLAAGDSVTLFNNADTIFFDGDGNTPTYEVIGEG